MDIADADRNQCMNISSNASCLLQEGSYVEARKLRFGTKWERGALCHGWFEAHILKLHSNSTSCDLEHIKDKTMVKNVDGLYRQSIHGYEWNHPSLLSP